MSALINAMLLCLDVVEYWNALAFDVVREELLKCDPER